MVGNSTEKVNLVWFDVFLCELEFGLSLLIELLWTMRVKRKDVFLSCVCLY